MFGYELEKIQNKEYKIGKVENINIDLKNKTIFVYLNNGDIIEYENNSIDAIEIWLENKMKKYYIDEQEGLLVFDPEIYWSIYKEKSNGKVVLQFLKQKVNGIELNFPKPEYYFRDKEAGVYGIYYNDKLLYIGSASSYIDRWKEHYQAFKDKDGKNNAMYLNDGINTSELEFRLLYNKEDIVELYNKAKLSEKRRQYMDLLTLEMIEKELIGLFKPLYNLEGKTSEYKFKSEINYWDKQNMSELEPFIKELVKRDWKIVREREIEEALKSWEEGMSL